MAASCFLELLLIPILLPPTEELDIPFSLPGKVVKL